MIDPHHICEDGKPKSLREYEEPQVVEIKIEHGGLPLELAKLHDTWDILLEIRNLVTGRTKTFVVKARYMGSMGRFEFTLTKEHFS